MSKKGKELSREATNHKYLTQPYWLLILVGDCPAPKETDAEAFSQTLGGPQGVFWKSVGWECRWGGG